jgi:hypothetical protein
MLLLCPTYFGSRVPLQAFFLARDLSCRRCPIPANNTFMPKKFYHRISTMRNAFAIWQRIQLAVRIRARFKNPNRSRVPRAICGKIAVSCWADFFVPRKQNSSVPTGHQSFRCADLESRGLSKRRTEMHLRARRLYDAQTVTPLPYRFIVIGLVRQSSIFLENSKKSIKKIARAKREKGEGCKGR